LSGKSEIRESRFETMVIDAHAHAFPDAIAERAIARLETGNCKARHDGTVSGLLKSMDRAGIDKAILCSIATKPEQFKPILKWSLQIASERVIPLASIHPEDPLMGEHMKAVVESGLKGIKIHPYYQGFDLGGEKALRLLEAAEAEQLLVVSHTGFDMAFPRDRIADPDRILAVCRRFPALRFVATHFGAWEDWGEVSAKLVGEPITMEMSLALESLSRDEARRMIRAHSSDRLLFGTDSPWSEAAESLRVLRALELPSDLLRKVEWENAVRIFRL
jgi:predicted TIM-barrel fold metal-dependent hydrolase